RGADAWASVGPKSGEGAGVRGSADNGRAASGIPAVSAPDVVAGGGPSSGACAIAPSVTDEGVSAGVVDRARSGNDAWDDADPSSGEGAGVGVAVEDEALADELDRSTSG